MAGKMASVVVVVLSVMLIVSMKSAIAIEEPTFGQRIDQATTDFSKSFNEHAVPAVDSFSSAAQSVYGWVGGKLRD
ncbi:PREDICTED: uncharacterized protein LOC109116671, partial [Tarenaya hassleriana]|uniref:uncharacterized protein LOC109116671 n=1 Tax=Tarenaya hassleriana TaxID=28532 RepID=UPI0008FD1B65